MTQCVVVADDVTGSADTGHEFARRGYTTEIALTQEYDPSASDVVVYNTDSRYVPPSVARTRVEAALSDPVPVVYKKIDSTLRGNVISEVEAVIAAAAPDRAVVAPAFPSNGRLTACGFHLVAGEMVTESDVGDDSDRPASHDCLADLFAESRYPVAHIGIDTVDRGPSSIATVLDRSGHTDGSDIVTCDAVDETHLASIADACERIADRCAFVGSGGLARYITLPGAPTEGPGKPDASSGHPVIGVQGALLRRHSHRSVRSPRVFARRLPSKPPSLIRQQWDPNWLSGAGLPW